MGQDVHDVRAARAAEEVAAKETPKRTPKAG